jgi:hypothetical protein
MNGKEFLLAAVRTLNLNLVRLEVMIKRCDVYLIDLVHKLSLFRCFNQPRGAYSEIYGRSDILLGLNGNKFGFNLILSCWFNFTRHTLPIFT